MQVNKRRAQSGILPEGAPSVNVERRTPGIRLFTWAGEDFTERVIRPGGLCSLASSFYGRLRQAQKQEPGSQGRVEPRIGLVCEPERHRR